MTTIGPTFPAHIVVLQAEVRLVADQTADAGAATIRLDQQGVQTADVPALAQVRPCHPRPRIPGHLDLPNDW